MKKIKQCSLVLFLCVLLSACDISKRFILTPPSTFDITIEGAIMNPGKRTIAAYATIGEVLENETLLKTSDVSKLNMNIVLHHQDKLTIPYVQKKACININTASVDELITLNQIGPVIAERIISYRNLHGLFQTIEDLQQVKGIGKATFSKNKDQLCV